MNTIKVFDVPFLQNSAGTWRMINNARWQSPSYKWVPNTRFSAKLKFIDWESTRSSAAFKFEALDGPFQGQELYMSLHHFAKVFPTQTITGGIVEGDWTFYKRGSAFSLGPA